MKNLKSKIKNMKGITLISLIITIIVLIILTGVTLNMLLGENGIINRTKIARDENEKETATETINLKITNVQISKYTEEQRMPTLKELADNFCEDNDFEKVIEKTEVGSLTKISNENPTAIIAKLKAYPYNFEINSFLQLASIDGVSVATTPKNDDDTIVSMTKSELKKMIQDEIKNNNTSQIIELKISDLFTTTSYFNNDSIVTIQKCNKLIMYNLSTLSTNLIPNDTWTEVGTLKEEYRPISNITETGDIGNVTFPCRISISTDGKVKVYQASGNPAICGGKLTYLTN